MSAPTEPAPEVPIVQKREFWVLMGYAVALGVFGAFVGLVFMGVIDFGGKWYTDSDPDWFGGQWWWVAVTAAAGVVVGLLRRLTRLPERIAGLFDDLKDGHVDPRLVPGIAAVSAVSLIGGASLGPEKALGAMGGGAGTWLARRRALGDEDSQVNTLVGFSGAYGGLFSSTVIVVMLILEAARPGGQKFLKALVGEVLASSVSFGIYFAIAGAVFLDAYQGAALQFEDWQLLAGIPLGLFAALLVALLAALMMLASRLFGRLKLPGIVKSTLGGVVFGLVGVALPLTLFTGSDQLKTVLEGAGTLGLGLLVATLIAKMLTFAVSEASGFIGGPIFPSSVPRGNGRGDRPPGVPQRAAGIGRPLPACGRPGIARPRTVLDGVDGRVPDPGGSAPDRIDPDRGRHRTPHDGGREVSRWHAQTVARCRGERDSLFERAQHRGWSDLTSPGHPADLTRTRDEVKFG